MNEQFQAPKGTPPFDPWMPEFIADPYRSIIDCP
jgi:hypothetical protein